MKVLVLSMTAGQGHNSAGNALKQYMEKKGHQVSVMDTYKFLNKAIGEGWDKGYSFMGRFVPKLNEDIYEQAMKKNGAKDMKAYFPFVFTDLFKSKMVKYLEKEKPDAIVCTIVFTAILVTQIKDAIGLDPKIKTYGIVTDFALHPFWEFTKMDYFITVNELLTPTLNMRGIPTEKILPIGIPVREVFSYTKDKMQAREELGLSKDKRICLITSGGRGFGALDDLVKQADEMENVQIVAICGTNAILKRKLEGMKFKNDVVVCGYVNNMEDYMDACDLMVAKPGGLSTSEALAKGKLLILTPPLPGVEDINLAFLLNHSLALHINKHMRLGEMLRQIEGNPEKVKEVLAASKKWGKPNSSKDLGDFIEDKYLEEN